MTKTLSAIIGLGMTLALAGVSMAQTTPAPAAKAATAAPATKSTAKHSKHRNPQRRRLKQLPPQYLQPRRSSAGRYRAVVIVDDAGGVQPGIGWPRWLFIQGRNPKVSKPSSDKPLSWNSRFAS